VKNFRVLKVDREIVLEVTQGENIVMTRSEAMQIAIDIVFLTCGNLVRKTENGALVEWNTNSEFFKAYATRCGLDLLPDPG